MIFKVAAKSQNTNSFGLYQFILISPTGIALKAHKSCASHDLPTEGDILDIAEPYVTSLSRQSYEMSEIMSPPPPPRVVAEFWPLANALKEEIKETLPLTTKLNLV